MRTDEFPAFELPARVADECPMIPEVGDRAVRPALASCSAKAAPNQVARIKRRLFLHDYGGYAFTAQLARALAARGYEVLYAYGESTQPMQRGALSRRVGDPPSLRFVGIQLSRPFQKYSLVMRWLQEREYGRVLAKAAAAFSPDVVLSANTPLSAQALLQRHPGLTATQHLFWLQDLIGLATYNISRRKLPVVGRLLGRHFIRLERRLLRNCDHIIAIDHDFVTVLRRWGIPPEKVSVIPNWAPLDEIVPGTKFNQWATDNGLTERFCFVLTGVLGMKHNPELLLSLARSLRPYRDALLVLVAQGPAANWIYRHASLEMLENIRVMPFQPHEHYPSVLATADVLVTILGNDSGEFCVPSRILSYMCARRPILAAIRGDNAAARLLTETGAGIAVDPLDENGFSSAAIRLMEDVALREQHAENGVRFAQAAFDIDRIGSLFVAHLDSRGKEHGHGR